MSIMSGCIWNLNLDHFNETVCAGDNADWFGGWAFGDYDVDGLE